MDALSFDYLAKVVLMGDTNVGKTSILDRYVNNVFDMETKSTIGLNFMNKVVNVTKDNKNICVKLQLWDTSGQERFKGLTGVYYRGAQIIMLVFDVTNRNTFNKLVKLLEDINNFFVDKPLIVIVGNKYDLNFIRTISYKEAENFAIKNGCKYFETSALENSDIDHIFLYLATEITNDKIPYWNLNNYQIKSEKKILRHCCQWFF